MNNVFSCIGSHFFVTFQKRDLIALFSQPATNLIMSIPLTRPSKPTKISTVEARHPISDLIEKSRRVCRRKHWLLLMVKSIRNLFIYQRKKKKKGKRREAVLCRSLKQKWPLVVVHRRRRLLSIRRNTVRMRSWLNYHYRHWRRTASDDAKLHR
jgi:hypothetical protein